MQYAPYSGQEGAKILFDFHIQTNIIVVVKQRKTSAVILNDSKVRKREYEKLKKYHCVREELEQQQWSQWLSEGSVQ